jgi:hypothetical protein
MKNLRQIFVLTKRDQRVVVVMMIGLLVVTFVQRYRHAQAQSTPLVSGTVSTAPPHTEDEQATADDRP